MATDFDVMVRLALKRHVEGIPKLFIGFDEQGQEVPWDDITAASPVEKHGAMEVVMPTPGRGYYCHISLARTGHDAKEERYVFQIASPTWTGEVTYVQPRSGVAMIVPPNNPPDAGTAEVLQKIHR